MSCQAHFCHDRKDTILHTLDDSTISYPLSSEVQRRILSGKQERFYNDVTSFVYN